MDWKYILSMAQNADELEESKKDELLNTIGWYDFTNEKVDAKKHAALLRLCQEIMKYKSEQVEALLAELDEMAVKQAEEEAKTRESDDRSSRSRKSLDSDEQDMRYRELKTKYRKLQKHVESNKDENEQLKEKIKMLEQERVYLQKELRNVHQRDDSASDISETVKDQQRNLMENVQQKNTQISQLLTDIENVESDNLQLRAQLSSLRDDLSDATDKIDSLVDDNKSLQVQIDETKESYLKMQLANSSYKEQIEELLEEKKSREIEFDQFASEIDTRIEDWKRVLETKNKEINQLKSKTNQTSPTRPSSSKSSTSLLPVDETQLGLLQKALAEREENIIRLQKQLEKATKDMLKSTQVLKQVTKERDMYNKKCEKINVMSRDLKKQLRAAHQRSQELGEDIQYQTKLLKDKENDINELIQKIEDPNVQKLSEEIEAIKSEKRTKEKKLSDLVRSYNKLRNVSDNVERENATLRDRLGLTEDDFISTKCVNTHQKRNKKLFDELKHKLDISEEEKLQYRVEVQKLSKIISNLSDQLLDLGETPVVDGQEINVSNLRTKQTEEQNVQMADATKSEYNALLEENDALRKGLHEILESIQTQQETSPREIKSETLVSLLRALDAKHVSGWYHPAMRLQAEVHSLQGSNTTLRDQLRIAREDLDNYKERALHLITIDNQLDSSNATAIANLNNHLINVLKNYGVDDETNVKLVEKLETYKKEFLLVQEQVGVLYNQYNDEKTKWEEDLLASEDKMKELIASNAAMEEQLATIKLLTDPETEDEVKIKAAVEASAKLVIMNRKMLHMDNLEMRYKNEINKLKTQLLEETQQCSRKVNKWKEVNMELTQHIEKLELAANEKFIFPDDVIKLQNDYDALLIKQRELQRTIEDLSVVTNNEVEILKKQVVLLESEKEELSKTLLEVKSQVNCVSDIGELQKRLAQSEINETTERQRANHTNSLYELVKEQLAKSEERHQEYQKYNGELMQKNLSLQESVKILEDKVVHYVDGALFHAAQAERDRLVDECQRHAGNVSALQDELNVLRKDMATRTLWSNLDQYECHSLRHQVVDLQATGDDKAVIARLSTDVVMARMAETEVRNKLDEMVTELTDCKQEMNQKISSLLKGNGNFKSTIETLRRKNSHLESIIKQQRNHYLGYVPYTSQENLVSKIRDIVKEKKLVYETMERTEQIEFDCRLIKEILESKTDVLNELNQLIRDGDAQARALEKWFLDKTNVQLQELRCRRQAEFKEAQLKHATVRLQDQEEQIAQLEAELLQTLCLRESSETQYEMEANEPSNAFRSRSTQLRTTPANVIEITPVMKSIDTQHAHTQTSFNLNSTAASFEKEEKDCQQICNRLQAEIQKKDDEIRARSDELQRLKQKNLELEMSISLLRQQMGDKQSQISFYEKHILEMQQNKLEAKEATNIDQLQQTVVEKERIIFELQSLLKNDRDEHSLAAARFQEELKQLQAQLVQQQQEHISEAKQGKPARAAVEYYIQQVHALEKLTTELQTSVSTLSTQLQASREECVRWKTLSNDRLQSVDELRVQLEEQHKNELEAYKGECEKWRSEVKTLQLYINAYKKDFVDLRPNIEKELKDKDNKIHELLITMRQLKTELRRKSSSQPVTSVRSEENFAEIKENFLREQEVLKNRCEQLLGREKSAREEIRNLKGQLMKRPAMSARSDTNPTKEQQLTKKNQSLEKEVTELREKLEREVALNEAHKTKVTADFDKWSKFKYWQQTAEKTKAKLREKTEECEKIQQTCSSYRMLIERLEREKHNLEVRVKNLKGNVTTSAVDGSGLAIYSALEAENLKLTAEISTLRVKLEQQQNHSGALSAAMLQDKLEAQERKIAILEMSAKGGGEMRAEMERVQNTNAVLQKANLRLEAEALDMRLDLEKSTNEVPHLREQINYLENYIKLLKSKNSEVDQTVSTTGGNTASTETKRISELERTVLVLKRVVEKLQVENKRLANGNTRSCTTFDRTNSGDRFKREYNRLKQQYDEKVDKVTSLEKELNAAQQQHALDGSAREELNAVREQLEYKGELLEKVKILLQRAAVKEKALLDQVSTLKGIIDSK